MNKLNMESLLNEVIKQDTSNEKTAISIRLSSPEEIRADSHGEVKKPETINYRTQKPENDGLFCARIFGPVADYECLCGKYKRSKQNKGTICSKCGVEVEKTHVRRERMGHIELATPIAHIWFYAKTPCRIGVLLGYTANEVKQIIRHDKYIILDMNDAVNCDRNVGDRITQAEYDADREKYGFRVYNAKTGGEALYELLRRMNLEDEIAECKEKLENSRNKQNITKLKDRINLLRSFVRSKTKPEWMILTVLPVLPPNLRPLVPLDGGRYASSDINELYRTVIQRNNRLKKLLEPGSPTPEILIRNEKRMLQEAVDALIDNAAKDKAQTNTNTRRPYKSLTDLFKGKKGRFRQGLLGKRVDYSGRSVISVGPYLQLHQCGLPKKMAKELFRPFIYHRLISIGKADSIKSAKRIVDREENDLWDALDYVVQDHPILLNRAPTLHRLGIQAFQPVLIEGKVIQLHPLVCSAFNADFDGDQMAVHVPLTLEAQTEARILMMANNNVLSPASGDPIVVPSQDMILGIYYMTREVKGAKGTGMLLSSPKQAELAYQSGAASLHAKCKVRITEWLPIDQVPNDIPYGLVEEDESGLIPVSKVVDTTIGRAILWQIAPKRLHFDLFNKPITKKDVAKIIETCRNELGNEATVILCDQIMYTGFYYACMSGVSIGIEDMMIPPEKASIIANSQREIDSYNNQISAGVVSASEANNKVIDVWSKTADLISDAMMKNLEKVDAIDYEGNPIYLKDENGEVLVDEEGNPRLDSDESMNSLYMMTKSGARGSVGNVRQIAGMRGLMSRPDGSIITTPILSNFREGLNVQEYFISTHGARKGLADTALKTAASGYLTRKLVDAAQSVVISKIDCGTKEFLIMRPIIEGGRIQESLRDRIRGRVLAKDVLDPHTKHILGRRGELVDEALCDKFDDHGIDEVAVRSPVLCEADNGICAHCYGRDLSRRELVTEGESVGIVAAQSIGEPGTQLTMRTIHSGGVAQTSATESNISTSNGGKVLINYGRYVTKPNGIVVTLDRNTVISITDEQGRTKEFYKIPKSANIHVLDGEVVEAGKKLADFEPHRSIQISEAAGEIALENFIEGQTVVSSKTTYGAKTFTILEIEKRPSNHRNTQPLLKIINPETREVVTLDNGKAMIYPVGPGVKVELRNGQKVNIGDKLTSAVVQGSGTNDITGGLPRVTDLFEIREPKNKAILAEIDGVVEFGNEAKHKVKLRIRPHDIETNPDAKFWEISVSKSSSIAVFSGDEVRRGDVLVEGNEYSADILRIRGVKAMTEYIVNEVQKVYRQQGVKINDKHIEVILHELLSKVRIVNDPTGHYYPDEVVDLSSVRRKNKALEGLNIHTSEDKRRGLIEYEQIIQGLTKTSLTNESFLAAAAFQETPKILIDAAIQGKVDRLDDIKNNTIVGGLIPCGTGYAKAKAARLKKELSRLENPSGSSSSNGSGNPFFS